MPQIVLDDVDGTLSMLRDSVASLAARKPGPQIVRARRNSADDGKLWSAMAEAGWLTLLLPEQHGGAGLGLREQVVLSEGLGRALLSEPVAASAVMASRLLAACDGGREQARLCEHLVSGGGIAVAWQDPQAASRDRSLALKPDGDGFLLDGDRAYVDLPPAGDDMLVLAEDGDGAVLLSVPLSTDGVSADEADTVDGGALATVRFEGVRVASDAVLARAASREVLMRDALAHARLAAAAELAGIASRAVEMTIAYTKERVQFGKPIASFQAIQHRLVEMWGEAEFACASVANAVQKAEAGEAGEAAKAVLAAKARCSDAAASITRKAVHLHGAMGFTDEHDIGLYLKRAVVLGATLGTAEALRLQFLDMDRAA